MSGRAVEAAGDVHTLLLDKTGTITFGNRQATEFFRCRREPSAARRRGAALVAGRRDAGRPRRSSSSPRRKYGIRGRELAPTARVRPFTAQTRMSGVDLRRSAIRKGAADAIEQVRQRQRRRRVPRSWHAIVERIARGGGTPLVVAERARALGVVHLKDIVKGGIRERFARLRAMGISTVMITGDNPLTAASIAAEAGVDDFLAEATPEDKMALIKRSRRPASSWR